MIQKYRYICVCVCDSKAREGKCDLFKSLEKMFVSNPSSLRSEEVLVSTDEAGPNAHLHPVGQVLFTRRLGWRQNQGFCRDMGIGVFVPQCVFVKEGEKRKKGEEFEQLRT